MKRTFYVTIIRADGKDNDFTADDVVDAVVNAWPYTFGVHGTALATVRVTETTPEATAA